MTTGRYFSTLKGRGEGRGLLTKMKKKTVKTPKKKNKNKNALYLSVNVFSTKVLIGDNITTSPIGDGITIFLRGHPSHAKVLLLALQREYLHFSVILRP